MRLDVVVVTASGSRSDVRGNIGFALSVDVRRSIVDSHDDVGRRVDGVRVVDNVGLDDRVDGDDGGDSFDGLDNGIGRLDGFDGRNEVSLDLDTLGVIGQLVGITVSLGGSALEGVSGSILDSALA